MQKVDTGVLSICSVDLLPAPGMLFLIMSQGVFHFNFEVKPDLVGKASNPAKAVRMVFNSKSNYGLDQTHCTGNTFTCKMRGNLDN